MKALRLLLVAVMVCGLSAVVQAEDKKDDKKADNAKLLVGIWEATKVAPDTLPKGAVVEFTKEGKLKVTAKDGDKEITREATYKLEGDKFTIVFKQGDQEQKQVITIKKISEKELVTENAEGAAVEFIRKK